MAIQASAYSGFVLSRRGVYLCLCDGSEGDLSPQVFWLILAILRPNQLQFSPTMRRVLPCLKARSAAVSVLSILTSVFTLCTRLVPLVILCFASSTARSTLPTSLPRPPRLPTSSRISVAASWTGARPGGRPQHPGRAKPQRHLLNKGREFSRNASGARRLLLTVPSCLPSPQQHSFMLNYCHQEAYFELSSTRCCILFGAAARR